MHVHVAFSFDTIPVIFKFWEGDGIVVQVSSDMCDGPSEVCKSCMAVADSRQESCVAVRGHCEVSVAVSDLTSKWIQISLFFGVTVASCGVP